MSDKIILAQGYQLLKSILGKTVAYAALPDLEISKYHCSCLTTLNQKHRYTFYHASPISFCVLSYGDWQNSFWIALDAGPDAAEEPWAPFAAWRIDAPITTCLYGEVKHPDGWIMKGQANDNRPSRLELWSGSPIVKITLYRLGVYAAMTCLHADGLIWSMYAEYDRMAWLSFDKEVAEAIETESDDFIVII